ncbi:hypothetical protein BD779DRAFT_719071 [Infundibulicybe gibba]|nr:hypothetical protein BD779DRAFT_719071 [Infundibulicybe gibba]
MNPSAQSPPGESGSPSDPASSLRAAALLTLKSKRRKPAPTQSTQPMALIRPPPPDNSIHLDYGQEDISSSPPTIPAAPTVSTPKVPVKTPSPEVEEGQIREEGEISDEEHVPSPPPNRGPTTLARARLSPTFDSRAGPSKIPTSPRMLVPKVESPTLSLSDGHPILNQDPPAFGIIDANHVRPGVAMTQEQYDTAKDLVLDLLGWGVPPEYLVDCGLSREIVFYVFYELNLRLPRNLDVRGLTPYVPTHEMLSQQTLSTFLSNPSLGSRTASEQTRSPSRPASLLLSHTDVPSSQDQNQGTTPTIDSASTQERSALGPTESLHDMENRRRQELLARKAVQASRKSRGSDTSSTAGPSNPPPRLPTVPPQDIEMNSIVPTEAVEDFLNSIGSAPSGSKAGSRGSSTPGGQNNSDPMNVDEPPGSGPLTSSLSMTSSDMNDNTPTYITENDIVASPESPQPDPPPSSTDSNMTDFDQSFQASELPREQHYEVQALQRRGTKRPVAADFVDFDIAPSRLLNNDHNNPGSHSNNGSYSHFPNKRKSASGFASASGMRRCVIDLSDSEGDGDVDDSLSDYGEYERWSRYNSRPSPPSGRPTPTPIGSGWATPLLAANTSVNNTTSPAVLMEKEMEIRKMRELIAQREQSRLKKLNMSRSQSAIDLAGVSESFTGVAKVQGSEIQPTASTTQNNPSPRTNGHSHQESLAPLSFIVSAFSEISVSIYAYPQSFSCPVRLSAASVTRN